MANTVNYTTTLDRFAEMLAKRKAAKLSQEKPGASEEDIASEAGGIANQQQSADRKSISKARDQVSTKILLNISSILMDISEDVSAIAEALPNLGGGGKKDTLQEEEFSREANARKLKEGSAGVIQNTAEGVFGLFEKIFAILTPFLLGFVLRFTDLTNPIQLLKDALVGVAYFMLGKFIYQLGKTFMLGLLKNMLDKWVGPKVINAPNSIINAGGIGAPGTGVPVGGFPGATNRRGKPVSAATQARYAQRFGAEAATARFAPKVAGRAGVLTTVLNTLGVGAMTTGGVAGGTGIPAGTPAAAPAGGGVLGKTKGLPLGKLIPGLATGLTLLSAPFQYSAKRDEGKSVARASTETGASVVGALGGMALGAAIGTAIAPGIGTAVGGVLGALGGEKVISSLTEGALDFFTGKPKPPTGEDGGKTVSIFNREEYEKLTPEQKQAQLQFNTRELVANPKELERLKSGGDFIPVSKLTNEELKRASADIATAKEKNAQFAQSTNFNIARGGDMNQQMIVNNAALEAEKSRRGLR